MDIQLFQPLDKVLARRKFKFDIAGKYILFAGAFQNTVKNAKLAIDAVAILKNVELLELKGYSREQVVTLMNAVDGVLMTSFTEGSPQFIKEAIACNCPVVSVPVGDVPEMVKYIEGCYISTYEPTDVAEKLCMLLKSGKRTEGRNRVIELELDNVNVAKRIVEVYKKVK